MRVHGEPVDAEKAQTIKLGEAAGEEAAWALFESKGISAVASTLRPRPYEGFAAAFYELWSGGEENWMQRAQKLGLGLERGAHPYYLRAFDQVYARGARRCCEMFVRGYLDARAGVPFDAPEGDSVSALEARLALRKRRTALGDRTALVTAYEAGYQLASEEN